MKKRIQAILSERGLCSRRTAEEWIKSGRVSVNGVLAEIGMSADNEADDIRVDGNHTSVAADRKLYVMLNKPVGYVTTLSDEKGRRTVADLVKDIGVRLYPVGRLDINSDGLILMTNDGELTNALTHPKHEVEKKYVVKVKGDIEKNAERLQKPMLIDGYMIRPAKTRIIKSDGIHAEIEIVIHEGRNRQVRKMCAMCGLTVQKLHRTAVGDLHIGNLPLGKWRYLSKDEVAYLKKYAKSED